MQRGLWRGGVPGQKDNTDGNTGRRFPQDDSAQKVRMLAEEQNPLVWDGQNVRQTVGQRQAAAGGLSSAASHSCSWSASKHT